MPRYHNTHLNITDFWDHFPVKRPADYFCCNSTSTMAQIEILHQGSYWILLLMESSLSGRSCMEPSHNGPNSVSLNDDAKDRDFGSSLDHTAMAISFLDMAFLSSTVMWHWLPQGFPNRRIKLRAIGLFRLVGWPSPSCVTTVNKQSFRKKY